MTMTSQQRPFEPIAAGFRRRHCHLAAALAGVLALSACGEPPAPAEPVRAVRVMTVGATGGAVVRDYAAEVHARVETALAFRVAGKISRRRVDLGQRVTAGQPLAEVDPADLRFGEQSTTAALRAAEVAFAQTAADYQRYEHLEQQGFISSAELERRNSALAAARAQRDQARAQASMQANQVSYAELDADAPGVITAVYADAGAVVSAGTPVLQLAHDGPRDVVFAVPEDQLDTVRALQGQPGGIAVTLWSGTRKIPATVREIAAAADPAARTFQVKADIPPLAAELGQTATVHLQLAPADGLPRLPLTAVSGRLDAHGGSRTIVWLLDTRAMAVHEQPVSIARTEGPDVVVASGLKAGDVVVTAGAHLLTTGQRVALYDPPPAH